MFAHYKKANVRDRLILKSLGDQSRGLYELGDTETDCVQINWFPENRYRYSIFHIKCANSRVQIRVKEYIGNHGDLFSRNLPDAI